MSDHQLYAVLVQAISGKATGFREAARHAHLVFVKAATQSDAVTLVRTQLVERDWHHSECQRVKIAQAPHRTKDETIREAALKAEQTGFSHIVYRDELRSDA